MFLTWFTYVLTISPFGNPWQNHNKQIRSYQRKKWSWGRRLSRKRFRVIEGVFGKVRSLKELREIKKNEWEIALNLYIEIHDSQWIKRFGEVSRFKFWQIGTLMDREAIENLSSIQKLPWWIKKLLSSYRDKFLKNFGGSKLR